MSSMGGIRRTERVSGLPSLRGQYAMAEARGVVCPISVLGIVGDLRSAGLALVSWRSAEAKLADILLQRCETHGKY